MKVHVETLDGLFRDLELTISEDGIDIANTDFGAHSYIIPWQEITAVDAGNLHPYKVNKIAIECRPRGRKTMLVKLYVPALPDVDALAQELLRRGMKAKHGRIPTPLHHPRMLRYYTPALRYALTIVSKFYRFLTFFGLFFYLTNLMTLVPEIDIDGLLDYYGDVMHAATTNPLWLIAAILLSPWAILIAAALLGLVLARNFTRVLLSLSALHDIGVVYAIAKDARHSVNSIRSLFALGHRSKKLD